MSVYVDDANIPFGRMTMCHMIADTEDELMAMADKIGVARKWIQRKPGMPWRTHFDICRSKKVLAVSLGAIEIDMGELADILARKRAAHLEDGKQ